MPSHPQTPSPTAQPSSPELKKDETSSPASTPAPEQLNFPAGAGFTLWTVGFEPPANPPTPEEQRLALLKSISTAQADLLVAVTKLIEITPRDERREIKIPWTHILGEHDAAIQYDIRVISRDGEVIRQQGMANLSEMTNPVMLAKSVQNFNAILHGNVFSPLNTKFADWIQTFVERDKPPMELPKLHEQNSPRVGALEDGRAGQDTSLLSDAGR